ncbi:MAG TPA: hypothetical protein VEU30_07375 [Thermoanaerobaculia bacterium]|nr:hypothetical protein [Thermoanaerobaculia bacterium]
MMNREYRKEIRSCLQSIRYREDEPVSRWTSVGVTSGGKRGERVAVRIRTLKYNPRVEEQIRGELAKQFNEDDADVQHTGPVLSLPLRETIKANGKLRVGSSISLVNSRVGTLGFFARCRKDPTLIGFVSANHVIGGQDGAQQTDAILHPGGSLYGQRVGTFVRSVPLGGGGEKYVDCAFAQLEPELLANNMVDWSTLPDGGKLAAKPAKIIATDMKVIKYSDVSSVSTGVVTSPDQDDFRMHYRPEVGLVFFDNQIEIESDDERMFSQSGDSGSLLTNGNHEPVGLLFAHTIQGGKKKNGLAYANPIREVLNRLDVDIYTGP